MNKAIFLDRDDTINVDKIDVYKIEDFELKPNVIEALKLFIDKEYKLIIITNQSGIGRSVFTKEDYYKFTEYLVSKLKEEEIEFTGIYFCPHKSGENCDCRKPSPGNILKGAKEHNINLKQSWMIGDKLSDVEAGRNAGCRTILLGMKDKEVLANYITKDLLDAANFIIENS
jgi:D,D-heptose 1,7-bisphosphate phosphatase|tara:strand:+ start:54 stop:569 length:516 start_codon:yes stop_codon:yes gene_type:complete